MRSRTWQIVNLIAVFVTLGFNALSQILPLNNQTSAEIANRFTGNYFFPANYVFSVWSVIYIGLIAFGIYQALPSQRDNPLLARIGVWFVVSCAANCIWLFFFHYNLFPLSMIAMIVLLVSLIQIYRAIRPAGIAPTRADTWCVRVPFSLYLGWITVATIANASYVLLDGGFNGFGIDFVTWGAIMIAIGGIIAGVFAYLNSDLAYAAVIVWAFAGIIGRYPDVGVVALPAGILAALVAIAALVAFFVTNRRTSTTTSSARA